MAECLNKKNMKTVTTAIILGLFGAIAVFVSSSLNWPTWIIFLAWVSYYLFGKSIKTSLPILLQMVLGIIMGLLIQVTGYYFANNLGIIGFPLAVFFFIGSLAFISKVKLLNNIPAWFLGLIVFFGIHPKMELIPLLSLSIPLMAGFIFAWSNDFALNYFSTKNSNL